MIQTLVEHSLMATGAIQAESMSVTLKERSSSASIVEEMTAEQREIGTWIRDGKGRVWRISRVEENPVTKTRTLTLEGILQTLKDRIIPTELDAGGMGGNTNCTATQAIRAILKYQSDWTLGGCDFTDSNPYSFDGEDLLSALETVLGSLEDPWLEIDTSRYPFRLYVRKASTTPQCEMRMSRNIVSMRRTVDTSGMFTRFYPIGKEDLRLSGNGYREKNVSKYGLKEKMSTDQSLETEAELKSWASEQLRKHARPDVSISISGVDLSADTGEPIDRLVLGTVCRVPLPEFGTKENERIIQLSWPDEINRPEDVTVTLGNELADVSRIVKEEVTGSSSTVVKSGRKSAKKAKEDHAWFVDTTDHVSMIAEAVAGEGASKDWSRVAEVKVDGEGIHQRVTKTEGQIVTHEARIEVAEDRITQEVTARGKQGEELSAKIEVTAEKITQEVENKTAEVSSKIEQTAEQIRTEVKNTKEGLESSISQTATQIRGEVSDTATELQAAIDIQADRIGLVVEGTGANAKIRPAQIVASINNATKESSVLISADRVELSGNTTIEDSMTIENGALVVKKAAIFGTSQGNTVSINNGAVNASTLQVNSGGKLVIVGSATGEHYDITSSVIQGIIKSASVSGNVLTLTPFYGNPITFSKATSLSGAWSGGVYQVTAKQNGTTVATHNYDPPMRLNGTTAASNFSAEIYEISGSSAIARKSVYGYLVSTINGASSYVDVNTKSDGTGTSVARLSVGSIYTGGRTDGWNQARGKVRIPGSGSAASITANWPGANYNTTETRKYELTDDSNNTVILRYNTAESGQQPNYVTAARYRHGKYEEGEEAGYSSGQSDWKVRNVYDLSIEGQSSSIGGRTQVGSGISKANISAPGYLFFSVSCNKEVKDYYIVINP